MGSSAFIALLHLTTALIQIGMNLSPTPDLHRVHKHQTTGQLALLPLVLMCFNNHLWLLYGLLTGSIFPLSAASLVGEVAGVGFTAVYCRWTRDRSAALKTCAYTALGMLGVTMYVLLGKSGFTHQSHEQVVQTLGYAGAAINICMYASPLATVRTVLETKSAASLPINLCCMIFLNCCMWVATAAVDHDLFVLIPSAIGLALSGLQLPLYFIYRPVHYVDLDAVDLDAVGLEEGLGSSTTPSVNSPWGFVEDNCKLPTTPFRSPLRPSRVAKFATFKYQRAQGTPLSTGSAADYASVEKGIAPSPMVTPVPAMTLFPLEYSNSTLGDCGVELEAQPLLMTPITAA